MKTNTKNMIRNLEPLIRIQPDADDLRKRLKVFAKQLVHAKKYARLEREGKPVPNLTTWGHMDLMLFLGWVDGAQVGTRLSDVAAKAEADMLAQVN